MDTTMSSNYQPEPIYFYTPRLKDFEEDNPNFKFEYNGDQFFSTEKNREMLRVTITYNGITVGQGVGEVEPEAKEATEWAAADLLMNFSNATFRANNGLGQFTYPRNLLIQATFKKMA
ncbi:hypothetical protein EW145_g7950 [Phellinidium pouzarii]|uniref:Uncharacterized protein n=1 Tax=Phellinidium pouzarii TaxID=167371 RepID=A0A4S4KBU2_9AGAM|nr:hypothetical protein EW145_g7950 [Phellinidium pouzarii]